MDIVGITGHAHNGKDALALYAKQYGYRRYAFADNVRRSLYALNPLIALVPSEPDYAEIRGRIVAQSGMEVYISIQQLVDALGWDTAKSYPNVRAYLQRQGTEAVRDVIAYDAWVMALRHQLDEEQPERVVITDVRFPNEAAAIASWGGALVRVVRVMEDGNPYVKPGLDLSHPSEAFIDALDVDVEFRCSSLTALQRCAETYFPWRVHNRH